MESDFQRQFINVIYTYNGEAKETLVMTASLFSWVTAEKIYSQREISIFKLTLRANEIGQVEPMTELYYLLNKEAGIAARITDPKQWDIDTK